MHRLFLVGAVILVIGILLVVSSLRPGLWAAPAGQRSGPDRAAPVIRCAVIGGLIETGFWQQLCERFSETTGDTVEVVAAGPKHVIAQPFTAGQADLITMHASDTIINLVADGHGENPQPWARNDLLLVGPPADPAAIHGMTDALDAVRKIVNGRHRLLFHRSRGAQEVLLDLIQSGQLKVDPAQVVNLTVDDDRDLLKHAAEVGAYTLVGRIPFRTGKIAAGGMRVMVEGDPRLRRPYVVVTAVPDPAQRDRSAAAQRLAAYLREPQTQAWIAQFGRGALDDRPLFFPVHIPAAE